MRASGPAWLAVGMVAGLAAAGCAATRLEGGVFHSPKGYQVAIPGEDWVVVDEGQADLELRARGGPARLVAQATCDPAVVARSPKLLARHLLASAGRRVVLEHDEVTVDSHPASHTVMEAQEAGEEAPIRVESYTLRGTRCVYDLVYAAPGEVFARHRPDFERFVASFRTE